MSTVAYALREEYQGTTVQNIDGEDREVPVFTGGVIRAGEDDFDVREALDEGDGVIVVAETSSGLLSALDEYPALKRVAVPEGAAPLTEYQGAPLGRLRVEAKRRGLDGYSRANREALIAALEEHDRRAAAGEIDADPVSVDDLADPDNAPDAGEED